MLDTFMSPTFDSLKTEKIWQYFLEITQVPRPTFHEEKIKAYLLDWADKHGFDHQIDTADNIVIKVPASKGYEAHATVVLQAHKDMVCEKNEDVEFDFKNDPLKLKIEDGWLKADGTTLGADNGLGIAAAMAIATDKNAKHPPLEILITASEERGLIGANNLSPTLLSGQTMINLDTESWGDIYVGCAGSQSGKLIFDLSYDDQIADDLTSIEIKVHGLKGGHSGLDIDKPRINAAKFLSLLLCDAQQHVAFNVNNINAGNLPNAIPREALAIISCNKDEKAKLVSVLQAYYQQWYDIYQAHEPGFRLDMLDKETQNKKLTETLKDNLLNILSTIHSGVLTMSAAMSELVETSNNLSSIKIKDQNLIVTIYTRSDNNLGISSFMQGVERNAKTNNAQLQKSPLSPGWKPDMGSRVLSIAKESYKALYQKDANIKAIHAGLECGAIYDKYPKMDMVSIGPTIENAHSPDEKAEIYSVGEFYQLLKYMLEKL
ncbi:beta-Ala-His dipeptidase [Facilibium subflavum]|uniref:beta-Ala-His dipeptidase n=1 Tax=Facilibium subflavum TaxID=2219058 RepID=UPI000E65D4B4|nr:beta-Ala-His dipeptidase [Facilibium subflavum]